MDGKVSDFFNEINGIAVDQNAPEWQECYDNSSGYLYYWNTKSNEVTWDMPANFKSRKTVEAENASRNSTPKPAPLFPSTAHPSNVLQNVTPQLPSVNQKDQVEKRKILNTSYGTDTESEEEELSETVTMVQPVATKGPSLPPTVIEQLVSPTGTDNEDEEIDLLTQIHNQAKVLTKLGGEIPASVKKIISHNGVHDKCVKDKNRKRVTGFSLVAGYSDSDEEDDVNHSPLKAEEAHPVMSSTLFPIAKPIDVSQFNESKKDPPGKSLPRIDTKVLKRKRRIGIDLTDTIHKPKLEVSPYINDERLGLGYKNETETDNDNVKSDLKSSYPGFKSGGLMLTESSTPDVTESEEKSTPTKPKLKTANSKKNNGDDLKTIETSYKSVSEKLAFLAEGREVATPVQTMIIQMETLYDAMKAKSLIFDYFRKWLHNTSTELVKLEKEGAPSGWMLKWDRMVKRYYYCNQKSGNCQWEYPRSDQCNDEEMDICTTPPPPAVVEEPLSPVEFVVQPALPPVFTPTLVNQEGHLPSSPLPPTISKGVKSKNKKKKALTPTKKIVQVSDQPLPPGVDQPQLQIEPDSVVVIPDVNEDTLGSALNSFYSDLATLELLQPIPVPPSEVYVAPVVPSTLQNLPLLNPEPEKGVKKKKTKVKIVEGLAMKKKGVSKLVEKWKNVQKDY